MLSLRSRSLINKPTFVSLGDPSGIGPEVFIKAIKDQRLRQHLSKIILVSSPKVIEGAISALDVKQKINLISDVNEAQPDSVNLINIDGCQDFVLGKPTFNNSKFIIECLSTAADLALKNSSCLVTGPLNKSIIQKHIQNFTGHTEFLKEKFNANEVLMYMTNGNLHLGITTTHVPLRVVPSVISRDLIKNKYKLLHHGLIDIFKLANPKIAVLGINLMQENLAQLVMKNKMLLCRRLMSYNMKDMMQMDLYPLIQYLHKLNMMRFYQCITIKHCPFLKLSTFTKL